MEILYDEFISWIFNSVKTANIESFAIAIFGIGITVFTVLYSFIGSKYELIRSLREKISEEKASIEEQAQYKIALRYVNRQIKINKYSIVVSVSSLILFLLCKIKNLFFPDNSIFQYSIDLLYIALILIVGLLIGWVLIEYRRLVNQ